MKITKKYKKQAKLNAIWAANDCCGSIINGHGKCYHLLPTYTHIRKKYSSNNIE